MGRDGPQLLGTLDVEHLIVKEDVRPDLLQQRPLGSTGEEKSLVDLQAPATQGFEYAGPGASCTTGRHQERTDGTVHTLVLGIKLPL